MQINTMALDRERGLIHNLNRMIIAGISIIASLLDGLDVQDILLTVAIVLWLWLPECDRLEERLYDYCKKKRQELQSNSDSEN